MAHRIKSWYIKIKQFSEDISDTKFFSVSFVFLMGCWFLSLFFKYPQVVFIFLHNPFYSIALSILLVLNGLDCYSTKIGLMRYGGRELNPFFNDEFNTKGYSQYILLPKLLFPVFITSTLALAEAEYSRLFYTLIYSLIIISIIVFSIAVINNFYQIYKKKRILNEFYESIPR